MPWVTYRELRRDPDGAPMALRALLIGGRNWRKLLSSTICMAYLSQLAVSSLQLFVIIPHNLGLVSIPDLTINLAFGLVYGPPYR